MLRLWMSASLLLPTLSLVLAGCANLMTDPGAAPSASKLAAALPDPKVVGGHQLGPEIDCSVRCDDVLAFAKTSAITTLDVDPVEITGQHVYVPFVPAGMTSSGGGYVVVYEAQPGFPRALDMDRGRAQY